MKSPIQLDLFTSLGFMPLDEGIEHLEPILGPQLDAQKSFQRSAAYSPATVFKQLTTSAVSNKNEMWSLPGNIVVTVAPKRIDAFNRNMKCVCCGREGNVFLLEKHVNENVTKYINLYCSDARGLVMMTVDHILPDSIGGKSTLLNLQTMCQPCNTKKSNRMSLDEIRFVRSDPSKYAKHWLDVHFLHAMLDVQEHMATLTDIDQRGDNRSIRSEVSKYNSLLDRYRKRAKATTNQATWKTMTSALQRDLRLLKRSTTAPHEADSGVAVAYRRVVAYLGRFVNEFKIGYNQGRHQAPSERTPRSRT